MGNWGFSHLPGSFHLVISVQHDGKSTDDNKRCSRYADDAADIKARSYFSWSSIHKLFAERIQCSLTNITPDGDDEFGIVGPNDGVYSSYQTLCKYPNGEAASTDVPVLEHAFRHGQAYQYARKKVGDRDKRECWVHVRVFKSELRCVNPTFVCHCMWECALATMAHHLYERIRVPCRDDIIPQQLAFSWDHVFMHCTRRRRRRKMSVIYHCDSLQLSASCSNLLSIRIATTKASTIWDIKELRVKRRV